LGHLWQDAPMVGGAGVIRAISAVIT